MEQGPILAIDIGNSAIKLGVLRQDQGIESFRIELSGENIWLELERLLGQLKQKFPLFEGAVYSSSSPQLVSQVVERLEILDLPMLIQAKEEDFIQLMPLDNAPSQVGIDRLVNALAVVGLGWNPAIILDVGTAITVDGIDQKGFFLGGAIAPGPASALDGLLAVASHLPSLDWSEKPRLIGKNTKQAMVSGTILGFAGLVDRLVIRMKETMDFKTKVIATGGMANVLAPYSEMINQRVADLTLLGLFELFKKRRTAQPAP